VQSVQQPKPLPPKRSFALFLEDSVNQLPANPALKRHHLESVVIQWLESISGSESYRERHCRLDTLDHSDGELIPRRLTESAPNIEYTWDTEGFVMPPTPTSRHAPSVALSGISSASTGFSRKSLVEDPHYRWMNLAENNISIRSVHEEFPEDIASLVDHVRKDRDSPGPSSDQLRQDTDLERLEMGTGESDVEEYFRANVFPNPKLSDSLQCTNRNPMAKQVVPDVGSELKLKVSTPVPDMLYGYNRNRAFHQQQAQLLSMGTEMVANKQGLIYPFFIIEFIADGPGECGSLWVATNQCLGGSASCVNIAERLNRQLRHYKSEKVQPINSAAFSIAMSGTEARLYISWKHNELDYYMRKVRSFALQRPKDYVEFRKHVRNIIDWGEDKRLKQIQESLDNLLEESRRTSEVAKSRPPPSDNSASSSTHNFQSSHYQGPEEDDLNCQLLEETEYYTSINDQDGWNAPAQQPLSSTDAPQLVTSVYGYNSTRASQPVASVYPTDAAWGYPTDGQRVLAADDGYNPDTLHAQDYEYRPSDAPVTPSYSSENVSFPLESHEGVDGSNTRGHRKRQRSRGHTDNSKARKTRKRP